MIKCFPLSENYGFSFRSRVCLNTTTIQGQQVYFDTTLPVRCM